MPSWILLKQNGQNSWLKCQSKYAILLLKARNGGSSLAAIPRTRDALTWIFWYPCYSFDFERVLCSCCIFWTSCFAADPGLITMEDLGLLCFGRLVWCSKVKSRFKATIFLEHDISKMYHLHSIFSMAIVRPNSLNMLMKFWAMFKHYGIIQLLLIVIPFLEIFQCCNSRYFRNIFFLRLI